MAARIVRRRLPDGSWVELLINDLLRKVFTLGENGEPVAERPFTAAENADVDQQHAELERAATELALMADARHQVQTMRGTIGAGDAPAGTDSLNAIINTPNATINQSPAQFIKALARLVRELTRAVIRLARIVTRDLDTPAAE